MTEESMTERMLRQVVFTQLLEHPLPWRVERDWTHEVTAADGYIVAKCVTSEEARAIVEYATKLRAELDENGIWAEAFLASLDEKRVS